MIPVYDLGLRPYEDVLELQRNLHDRVVRGLSRGVILCVEHPSVVTLGRHARKENVDFSKLGDVPVFQIERGGDVTAHEPGQVVVYPILPLKLLNNSVKNLVSVTEEAVIRTLREYGCESARSEAFPGVWVGNAKIAALGYRIKDRVSLHGVAMNINNSLDVFESIVPCGIQGKGLVSLKQVMGCQVDQAEFKDVFFRHLSEALKTPLKFKAISETLQHLLENPIMLDSQIHNVRDSLEPRDANK